MNNPAVVNVSAIADAIWDEAVAGHVTGGTVGNLIERLDLLAAGGGGELNAARAALLSNIDVAVSTAVEQVPGGGGPFIVPATGAALEPDSGSSGNNSYGSHVEMIASTAADAILVGFGINFATANIANIVLDISIGAGGSEVSIGEYPLGASDTSGGLEFAAVDRGLRIAIASGSRIAVRTRDESSSAKQMRIYLMMVLASDYEAWNA
jgi:hypothetical protein